MNWLLLLVVLFLAWNVVWGYSKGFLRTMYAMAAWILLLVFVTLAMPVVSEALVEYTSLDENIDKVCTQKLRELVRKDERKEPKRAKKTSETANDRDGEPLSDLLQGYDVKLPDVLLARLLDADDAVDRLLEENDIYGKMAARATDMAVKGIAYMIVFAAAFVMFHVLNIMLDIMSKLPVIGEVNHFFGALAGTFKGVVVIWLVFAFIALGSATSWGTALVEMIYDSPLLKWVYENNQILALLMRFI